MKIFICTHANGRGHDASENADADDDDDGDGDEIHTTLSSAGQFSR